MQEPDDPRIIRLDGARNVRDLGGLDTLDGRRTRRGRVFRGDGLSRLSDADLERVGALGIRTIIDLRYRRERERAPDRLPAASPPALIHRGIAPRGSLEVFEALNHRGADAATATRLMCDNYARMPFEHAAEFRAVLHDLMAPASAPHLIHCTSGKDRTGIVVALLLRVVGVDDAAIVADFALSNVEHQPVDVFEPQADPAAVAVIMSAAPQFLDAALAAVDAAPGGFSGYLERALGLGADERGRLRELLLEPR
ncbi:MAG: tyrosine-protein phosphatase [Gammaproteobacteria bacterium]